MAYRRAAMRESGVIRAIDLRNIPGGRFVRIAGVVIARQRPGTASGFISLEDETGISNAIIHPKVYEQDKITVTRARFLLIEGTLQNQDGVIHIKAAHIRSLNELALEVQSHDFH
jgi:error-prone DNA polymerase